MREIKIWDGAHADEKKARECGRLLRAEPRPHIKSDVANPLGCSLERRVVDVNMTLAYPGDPNSPDYERRRAAEVLAESQGFYSVIDLHNIRAGGHGETTAILDLNKGVDPIILGWLGTLGIKNLITSQDKGLHGFVPNSFTLEASEESLGGDIPALCDAFDRLANDPNPPVASVADFQWFAHAGNLHVDHIGPDCLNAAQRSSLRGFDLVPDAVTETLDLVGESVHFLNWHSVQNENGFWGEVVVATPVPDSSSWPK